VQYTEYQLGGYKAVGDQAYNKRSNNSPYGLCKISIAYIFSIGMQIIE